MNVTGRRMHGWLRVLAPCALGLGLSACGGGQAPAASAAAPPPPVQIGSENVVVARSGTIVVGPIISGDLRAEREARVRAELGGEMLEVNVEEGQPVRKGTLLGRIEARALGDARQSAATAVRSAESQLEVARREAERTEQLVEAGALAARELDTARANVAAAEAAVADAQSRLATAETELADAEVRAPITGVVAARAVDAGDIVSPGTELFTIIDPTSMRLEAAVPSDDLGVLRTGVPVQFRVRGYAEPLEGEIARIAPQADPTTRQVPIYVRLRNTGGRFVAGLYAEGRVVVDAATGIVVPVNAVNTTGDKPWVMRVNNGKAERVDVAIGLVDGRTERLQIASGVNDGDILLRGAAQGITPGTAVAVAIND